MFAGIRCNFCGMRRPVGWYDHSKECSREVERQRQHSEDLMRQVADTAKQEAEAKRVEAEKRRAYRRAEGFED